ncbi:MAG: hypothetical protein AAFY06_00115 [Pseudomonadota bacterium]
MSEIITVAVRRLPAGGFVLAHVREGNACDQCAVSSSDEMIGAAQRMLTDWATTQPADAALPDEERLDFLHRRQQLEAPSPKGRSLMSALGLAE